MKHGILVKILLFALVISLVALPLFSCKKTDNQSEETSDTGEANVDTGSSDGDGFIRDENGFVIDEIPDDANLNEKLISILRWKDYDGEFSTEIGTEVVSDAIYRRVSNIEERLTCYLNIETVPGDWPNRNEFVKIVENDVLSGSQAYDIIAQYSFSAPNATMKGLYKNINDIENINLKMPWWDKDIINSTEISGKLYFTSGDIAPTTIFENYCMFFNKEILENNGFSVDELYKTIMDGKWTLEGLKEMTVDMYEDKNADFEANDGDMFGLDMFDHVHYDAFFYAFGLKIIEKNNQGGYSLANDFKGEKAANLVKELGDYTRESDDVIINDKGKSFKDGNSVFILTCFNYAIKQLKDCKFAYGVAPVPKYTESQENYCSTLAVPYTMYSVPHTAKDVEDSGMVIEALASDAYRNISPSLFEIALKTKYSETPIDAEIYDIIRESRVYDIGRMYGEQIATGINPDTGNPDNAAFALFRNTVHGGKNWGSELAKGKALYVGGLKEIMSKFEEMEY